MSYKITRKNEVYTYEAPGHFDVRTTRVHDAADVNGGGITMGLSHFLPGGGCNYSSNAKETIYYIIEGQMYLESEIGTPNEVKTTLYAGDSYHCGPGTEKSVVNTGQVACQMLVALANPVAE
ncbi:MAG: cupin domain-containing protein [Clostridiales Family XIII bacterium]|jgi:mannose-6-phosphate isomerase-like protein (cupin superfamily)|nr:cupin domain-containing protein [Clostridiales Family XIII bacterium]